jgi:hypothetical protein
MRFIEEKVKKHNKSMMNVSRKDEITVYLLSGVSGVNQGQTGDSDLSETLENIDSTGEQEKKEFRNFKK